MKSEIETKIVTTKNFEVDSTINLEFFLPFASSHLLHKLEVVLTKDWQFLEPKVQAVWILCYGCQS